MAKKDFSALLTGFRPYHFFKCQLDDGTRVTIDSHGSINFSTNYINENQLIDFLNYLADKINPITRLSIEIPFDEPKLHKLLKKTKFHCSSTGVYYTYIVPLK